MQDSQVAVGLDIGTTSTKAVVFGKGGVILGKHAVDYPLIHPQPAWAEQEPEQILQAVIDSIRHALRKANASQDQVLAVGMSCAMHSLILLDRDAKPITRSIIWADNRSVRQAEKIKTEWDGHQIYLRTGTPIHPMSPLTKILWFKEERPDLFAKAAKFVSIKEYVVYRLFGQFVVDESLASATGLFHLQNRQWDEKVLQQLGIRSEQLSTIVPTTHVLTGLHEHLAIQMGLRSDTKFVMGASDGVLANLGVGAIEDGEIAVTIGTSGAIRTVTDRPRTDEKGRTFCYALTDRHWVIGGPTNNGGILLRWLRDEFAAPEIEVARKLGIDPYDLIIQYAEKVPAGSEGLLFLPFLSGERAPYWNANARGVFFGIGMHHKREHFIRAVLEGVIFSILSVGVALHDLVGPAKDIRASGGFAKSPTWRQILSDVMGRELLVPESHEASALGAAALALYALGEMKELKEVKDWIRISHRHQPHIENTEVYMEMFYMYERVYHKLKDEFELLAKFQTEGRF
ncbi:gluconokinase [Thermoflavimicrobium dichotomicum]|uniref:Gluconokinase n=1 Tax=Thermoflavimicrobium dichotomicum TaxID=46223 RepID=A0A1I3RD88_9BACL|nr:gluconokinase [Thermoflavimicrobium dichotomicum]SFJ43166.1 gluconokinase [Thermoflavimicrobium dichotomicum]